MFSLLHGFYEELTYVRQRPIALLGVEASGKSSVLEWLKLYFSTSNSSFPSTTTTITINSSQPSSTPKASHTDHKDKDKNKNKIGHRPRPIPPNLDKVIPTVGLNVAKLRIGPEKALVWDLGGTASLRSIWDRYSEEAEALIWVVDSADRDKLHDSRNALKQLMTRENLKHSPLLVLANKQDLDNAMDPVKISLALDLLMEAELRPQCIQPCSSKTGDGIREGVEWMMSCLKHEGEVKPGMRIP